MEKKASKIVDLEEEFMGHCQHSHEESSPLFTPEKKKSPIVKRIEIARALSSEFIGTFLLLFVGIGMIPAEFGNSQNPIILTNAIECAGVIVSLIFALEVHSGAVFNPAVTFALVLARELSPIVGALYMISQFLGAIFGTFCLKQLLPIDMVNLMDTTITKLNGVSQLQGCMLECIMTFFLVTVVLFVCANPSKTKESKNLAPFVVGGVIIANILFGASITGASMNPARSLGPAIVMNYYKDLWVYFVGPFLGAVLAVAFYAGHHTSDFFRHSKDVRTRTLMD